ncbi:hypothetical protein ACA910_006048 [Epithemia clementina (nom. ined.)]
MGKQKKGSARKNQKQDATKSPQKISKDSITKVTKLEREQDDAVVTMEALRAMSDSDSDGELPPEDEWNEEARSLKKAIEYGLFNKLLKNPTSARKRESNEDDDDESLEEVILDDDDDDDDDESPGTSLEENASDIKGNLDKKSKEKNKEKEGPEIDESEDENDDVPSEDDDTDEEGDGKYRTTEKADKSKSRSSRKHDDSSESQEGNGSEEEDEEPSVRQGKGNPKQQLQETAEDVDVRNKNTDEGERLEEKDDDHDDDRRNDDEEEDEQGIEEDEEAEKEHGHFSIKELNAMHQKSLRSEADRIFEAQKKLTWPETFDFVSAAPLPFDQEDEEGNKVDIHDDLKREVAFYNMALEAAIEGRRRCEAADIPFSRPDDFFAEMVKTDEHMAKIKDRLIFENKKIEAVNQRKANKEQKLRSRESQATKLAEKAKRKKDNLKAVDDWAKNAASKRNGGQLSNDFGGSGRDSPNKKRMSANKRYGFGGKKGRFKQTDPKALNDLSGYSARGNFAGGQKRSKSPGAAGGGKRPGKRAREASRSRTK